MNFEHFFLISKNLNVNLNKIFILKQEKSTLYLIEFFRSVIFKKLN